MGNWGIRPFDNTTAANWLLDIDAGDLAAVRKGLADDNPEIVHASASLVAALTMRKARIRLDENARDFVAACTEMPGDDDVADAAEAVTALLTSHLAESWDEAGETDWRSDTELLLGQLGGGGAKAVEKPSEAWERTVHRLHRMSVAFELRAPQIIVENEIRLLKEWSSKLAKGQAVVGVSLDANGVTVTREDGHTELAPNSSGATKEALVTMRKTLGL